MNLQSIVEGALRIWREDQVAVYLTIALVFVQLAMLLRVLIRTRNPLQTGAAKLRAITETLKKQGLKKATDAVNNSPAADYNERLRRAWAAYFGKQGQGFDADSPPADEAFDSSRLLPTDYNGRIDAAAPGLFTALGIVGTFIGLILGFLRVNPAEATGSVGPLLGGMVVAFLNSLLGVSLSVIWSYRSRIWRHDFDVACDRLSAAAESKRDVVGIGEQLLGRLRAVCVAQDETNARLGSMDATLVELRDVTKQSGEQLLENLSTTVRDSFKAIVNAPFDQLNESVIRFDDIVRQTSERQEEVRNRLDAAAAQLALAETRLSASLSLAKECVEEFSTALLEMKDGVNAADLVVSKTQSAAADLARIAGEVQQAAARYETLGESLSRAIAAAHAVSDALVTSAGRFDQSSGHLERAVATIQSVTDETVESSVAMVRQELENAIHTLVQGLRQTGLETTAAYQASSELVVRTVDAKMSDLTDRLSAELTTLASRLPTEVESLNQAMLQIRAQIQRATRSMDDAVNQLAHQAPNALSAHLDLFDRALGKAMDHFSGTLEQWDGKISAIESLVEELRKVTVISATRLPTTQPLS